jgi:hypothetical protein
MAGIEKIRGLALPFVLVCLLGCSTLVAAQFGFWGGRGIQQNEPPATELVVARLRFSTNGRIGNMGWSHNYPDAEMNLNQFIGQTTRVNVERMSFRIVELASDELFSYPFALISEPGEMELTPKEIQNFRQYIARGGFIVVDDFDGDWQLDNFRHELAQVFPDRELEELKISHSVFNTFYQIESLTTFEPYVPGDIPVFYGLRDEDGKLVVVACHNNDLMNFWDWIGQARYPLRPATEAFRMGTNFLVYAMTH